MILFVTGKRVITEFAHNEHMVKSHQEHDDHPLILLRNAFHGAFVKLLVPLAQRSDKLLFVRSQCHELVTEIAPGFVVVGSELIEPIAVGTQHRVFGASIFIVL